MSRCCSQCGSNGHNSRTCGGSSAACGGGIGGSTALGGGGGEIILFGVRVKVDPMRKSVSMNNLSEYELPNNLQKNSINSDESAKAADDASGGYASADDAVPLQSTGGRDRKRGVPWTEEEHKLFLLGLQKVGKGDWRGISRNFVKTRTPTQVASHAQKYYLRRTNLNRRRRRSSLFDITTDSVTGMVKEGKSHEDNNTAQAVLPATSLPPAETSNFNGFSVAPFPVSVGPILVPVQVQNPLANITIHQGDNWNSRSALLVRPAPVVIPVHNSATPAFLNLNHRVEADSPLSLRLSLSSDQSQSYTSHSAFQVMPSYNNGDSITVA